MTVAELIAKLKEYPSDMPVRVQGDDGLDDDITEVTLNAELMRFVGNVPQSQLYLVLKR
jgi:hypothetical protein